MILAGIKYVPQKQASGITLVWLHGFLGTRQEWLEVVRLLPNFSHLLLDLPGHGESASLLVTGFTDTDAALRTTLRHHQVTHYLLIGYSLGARLAMYHACQGARGLQGVLVEGGHPGLVLMEDRQKRLAHDARWAARFRQESLESVLQEWYLQEVFIDLSSAQRDALVTLRSRQCGIALAAMLEATSLAKQPFLAPTLRALTLPFRYLCGERDQQFLTLAQHYHLMLQVVLNAGHNTHRANPQEFVHHVRTFFTLVNFETGS